jgi:hypothetical protein
VQEVDGPGDQRVSLASSFRCKGLVVWSFVYPALGRVLDLVTLWGRSRPNAVALGPGGAGRRLVDAGAAAHGGLGTRQAWREVVLRPRADQLGDAVQVLWLLVKQDADRPPLLGQDVLEATEARMLCGLGQEVGAERRCCICCERATARRLSL